MCTAIRLTTRDHYFGRNLDLEYSYQETVAITPRRYPFHFRHEGTNSDHFAMIGMAFVVGGMPLYYEATNEKGLSMAGLNFPASAVYHDVKPDCANIASFELIPYILGQCESVQEAKTLLQRLNITRDGFSEQLPPSPLHWMIDDREGCIVVESMADGLHVYDNWSNVMTNEPPLPLQLENLAHYQALSPEEPVNRFAPTLPLKVGGRCTGAIGLPGDWSPWSRFVRAAFLTNNSVSGDSEEESVGQFFHILGGVAHPRGCAHLPHGYEITVYTSCCNADTGVYYYTTYGNQQICAVDMHKVDLDGGEVVSYELKSSRGFITRTKSRAGVQNASLPFLLSRCKSPFPTRSRWAAASGSARAAAPASSESAPPACPASPSAEWCTSASRRTSAACRTAAHSTRCPQSGSPASIADSRCASPDS